MFTEIKCQNLCTVIITIYRVGRAYGLQGTATDGPDLGNARNLVSVPIERGCGEALLGEAGDFFSAEGGGGEALPGEASCDEASSMETLAIASVIENFI